MTQIDNGILPVNSFHAPPLMEGIWVIIIVGTLLFIASVNRGTRCIYGIPHLTSPIPVTKLAAVVESSLPNPANEHSSKNGECASSNSETRLRAKRIGVRIKTTG